MNHHNLTQERINHTPELKSTLDYFISFQFSNKEHYNSHISFVFFFFFFSLTRTVLKLRYKRSSYQTNKSENGRVLYTREMERTGGEVEKRRSDEYRSGKDGRKEGYTTVSRGGKKNVTKPQICFHLLFGAVKCNLVTWPRAFLEDHQDVGSGLNWPPIQSDSRINTQARYIDLVRF